MYKVDPWDDVAIGDHRFFFGLRFTAGQSLLVWKGAFKDSDLALDVVNCVTHVSTSNVIFLPVNVFTNIVNVDPCSATMVVESVHNV